MKTLESVLRSRLGDSRALVAVLDIRHDRVFLQFGQIGPLEKIVLSIDENEITALLPALDNVVPSTDDELTALREKLAAATAEVARLSEQLAKTPAEAPETPAATVTADPETPAHAPAGEAGQPEQINPDDFKHAILLDMAEKLDPPVTIPPKATKADLAKLINGHREALTQTPT